MKISFLFLCLIILFSAGAFRTSAALLPRLGPVDISGVIDDVRWIPETTVQGKPGMSGSAGRDRAFSPHFRVKLTDFSGVDASTAIAMTRYLDWSAYNNDGRPSKPTFVLLKIDYPDKNYLKKGMKTKSSATPSGAMKAEHVHLSGGIEFLNQTTDDNYIRRYLENSLESPGFGGKMFCTYELYGKEPKGNKQQLYLWAFCMEYYIEGGVLQEGTGVSIPVVLVSVPSCDSDLIETHFKPADGEDYGNSIRGLFPPKYLPAIFAPGDAYNRRADTLQQKARENARIYYHLK